MKQQKHKTTNSKHYQVRNRNRQNQQFTLFKLSNKMHERSTRSQNLFYNKHSNNMSPQPMPPWEERRTKRKGKDID